MSPIHILGFAGSLRAGSYHTALLHAATEVVPAEAEPETFALAGIPPYNQDLDETLAASVLVFKAKINSGRLADRHSGV